MIQNGEAQETTLANYTEGRKSVKHVQRKTLNSLQSYRKGEVGAEENICCVRTSRKIERLSSNVVHNKAACTYKTPEIKGSFQFIKVWFLFP